MAYRAEKNGQSIDIVIDGFELGIADDPYEGIADIRNANVTSVPKEASVAFANAAITLPPVLNTTAFTCTASTDIITISSTTGFYAGMAIIINTVSGGTGLSATAGSNTYYVGNITSTTFKLYTDPGTSLLVDILMDGTGTLSTAQFGRPVDSYLGTTSASSSASGQFFSDDFIVDHNGQAWYISNGQTLLSPLNTLHFLGNTNHSTVSGSDVNLCVFKGYLFVFIDTKIDYIKISNIVTSPNGNWHIGWQSISSSPANHKALAATDDAMYFCNGSYVGSVLQNAGSTFDPATSSTYTFNTSALALPTFDNARCLAQLGTTLLIGGISNFVYPWDRISTSFNYPLIVAEPYIKNIVSTNSSAFIFAGNRGRIYLTNGANIELFKKFPDQISGTENPYYTWGDALYYRNQLYFGISGTTNGATTINNFSGVWALSLDSGNSISSAVYGSSAGALYMLNQLSYNTTTYTGTVPVIMPMGNINPVGNALYVGWVDGSNVGGIDYASGDPYTNYQTSITTDIIPVGTYYKPQTGLQLEYKLSKSLVSGEAVKIGWRGNLTDAFVDVPVTAVVGQFSGAGQVNFQKQQWVQFQITSKSTATTPSYTKLREIRLRTS